MFDYDTVERAVHSELSNATDKNRVLQRFCSSKWRARRKPSVMHIFNGEVRIIRRAAFLCTRVRALQGKTKELDTLRIH